MTVRWLGALTDDQRFSEARSYFPPCYSQAFHDCLENVDLTKFPNCARMKELWTTDKSDAVYKKLDAEVAKLPFCPEVGASSVKSSSVAGIAAAGVAGLVIGLLLGKSLI